MSIGFAIGASALATVKDSVSKYISSEMHGNVSACTSFLFALPFYVVLLAVLWFSGFEHFQVASGFFIFVLLRALADCGAETFKMHALSRGELSVVTAMLSLHPVVLLFLSPLITKDPVTVPMAIGVCITVVGTLFFLIGPGFKFTTKGCGFALGAACFFSLNNCFDRLSVQTASPALSAASMTLVSGLLLIIPCIIVKGWKQQIRSSYKPLFLRGACEVAFMVSKLIAMTTLTGPQVSALIKLSLIFSVLSGKTVFHELGFVRKLIGSVVTIIGVIVAIGW